MGPVTATKQASNRVCLAVAGVHCRLPGDSTCPQEFGRVLDRATDAIVAAPADRLDTLHWKASDGTTHPAQAGFVMDVSAFDSSAFHVSNAEVRQMMPTQRMMLEVRI